MMYLSILFVTQSRALKNILFARFFANDLLDEVEIVPGTFLSISCLLPVRVGALPILPKLRYKRLVILFPTYLTHSGPVNMVMMN